MFTRLTYALRLLLIKFPGSSCARLNHRKKSLLSASFFVTSSGILLITLALPILLSAQTVQTYSSSGTFTVPAEVTQVTVECIGGGGGGGRARGNPATGGGGAGGSYVRSTLTVTPGTSYTVTVGAGGSGGNSSTSNGSAGGDSWFSSSSTIIAIGGAGGLAGNSNNTNGSPGTGSTTGCIGTTKYAGGNGSTGNYTSNSGYSGAGGGGAGSTGAGGNASNGTGGSGTTLYGGNGANGVGNNKKGTSGFTYGGAGSGGKANTSTDRDGGSGAGGFVVITYNLPPSLIANPTSLAFGYVSANATSSELTYSLSGSNLTGYPSNIVVTAPSNFEISLSSGTGFAATINVPYTTANLSVTTIYARFRPTSPNTDYSGNITNSGGGTSTSVEVSGTSLLSYCTPSYTTGTNEGDYIAQVQLGSINNTTTGLSNPYYYYYSNLSTDLTQGVSYTVTVKAGTYIDNNNISVWIDFNQNGTFDSEEKLGNVTLNANQSGNISFTVPANAATGTTRMRVRETWNNTNIDPCASYNYGEVEDYNINILSQCNVSVTAASTYSCMGSPTGTGTITATAINGTAPYTFNINGGTYQSQNVFTGLLPATYVIGISDQNGCTSSVNATVTEPPASGDNQNSTATNSWIGHVYEGVNFTTYTGHYTEAETFDQSFGGNQNCFEVNSGAELRSIYTETFSVKYRMNSNRQGLFAVNLGSDDGTRLTIDGNLVYNNWSDQGFTTRSNVLIGLTGSSSLLYEYYENGGSNRVIFQNLNQLIANTLTENLTQTICTENSGSSISGDVFASLPSGISYSGTGYQWTYSTTPSGTRTLISGATSATYTPSAASAPFNTPGTYYIFRNAVLSGSNNISPNPYVATLESNAATITIIASAAITQQPVDQQVCAGQPGQFQVTASGSGLTYQWWANSSGSWYAISDNSYYSGTSTAQLTISNTATWMNNYQFRVVVSNSGGCDITSNAAVFSVNASPEIYNQPVNSTICETGSTSFDVNSSGTSFQWQISNDGGSTFQNLTNTTPYSGVTTRTLQISSATNSLNTKKYRAIVGIGGCSINSAAVLLTVNPLPLITSQPTNVSTCTGSNAQFSVNATGSGLSYQWQAFGGSWYNISDGTYYSGTSTENLTVLNAQLWQDGYKFRVLVSNDSDCSLPSSEATLSVSPQPEITISYPGTPYCTTISTSQSVNLSGPIGGTFTSEPPGLSLNASTGAILPSASGTGIYTVTYTYNGCVNVIAQTEVTIVSGPAASVSIDGTPNPFCSGTAVVFTATPVNGGSSPTYQWKVNGYDAGTNSPGFTYDTPANDDVVTCVMTSSLGCVTGNPATSPQVILTQAAPLTNNDIDFSNGLHGKTCATASENSTASATSPEGTYFSTVNFASYGTPGGSCPDFTLGSCHAATSRTIVENAALGNSSFSIQARNSIFGDPCVGTVKHLYVAATYTEPTCAGLPPGLISGSTPTGGNDTYTYLWEMSSTGPNSGFSAATGVNNARDYSPPALYTTTWFRRTVFSAGCSNTSYVLQINVTNQNMWTGAQNSDWNNDNNWTCHIPLITSDVVIGSGLTNYPVLSTGDHGLAHDITLASGASLSVDGNTLEIAGQVTGSGEFDAMNGTIEFRGSSEQTIEAGQFLDNEVLNLTINNAAGVVLSGPLNIKGIVTPTTGNLSSNGYLTLLSDAASTALISGSGSGEVNGDVTMQRYLYSSFGYRYLSSPFTDATVAGFSEEIDLGASFPSFFNYLENKESSGWNTYTNASSPLSPLSGFCAQFGTSASPVTVNLTGTVNNHAIGPVQLINHNQTYTQGFHLEGNPYPSPIDWNSASGWTKINIDNAVYFFSPGTMDQYGGTYSSYINGISSNGVASNIIASMQGFFVHVSDGSYPVTASFGINNLARTDHVSPLFFKAAEAESRPMLRLNASFVNGHSDALVIYFDEQASADFDANLDALKLINTDKGVPNIYALTPGKRKLSIAAFPLPDGYTEIPLGILTENGGILHLSIMAADNIPAGYNTYLKDNSNGSIIHADLNEIQTLQIAKGNVEGRFSLVFSNTDQSQPSFGSNSFDVSPENGQIILNLYLKDEQVEARLTNMAGQTIVSKVMNGEGRHLLCQTGAPGIYLVTLITDTGSVSKKIFIP